MTDIDLSLDDRFLYASCWGTGELKQFDVSDPHNPKETGSVRLGGMAARSPHPASGTALNGGPQMVEISRDGRRVYLTNSLYRTWDDQFYPDGIESWMVNLDAGKDGGLKVDPNFFLEFDSDFRGHQVRLQAAMLRRTPTVSPSAETRKRGGGGAMDTAWFAATLIGLRLFHGLNPAMGWLFAVALGMQEGHRRAVINSLAPQALGHAASMSWNWHGAMSIWTLFSLPPPDSS